MERVPPVVLGVAALVAGVAASISLTLGLHELSKVILPPEGFEKVFIDAYNALDLLIPAAVAVALILGLRTARGVGLVMLAGVLFGNYVGHLAFFGPFSGPFFRGPPDANQSLFFVSEGNITDESGNPLPLSRFTAEFMNDNEVGLASRQVCKLTRLRGRAHRDWLVF